MQRHERLIGQRLVHAGQQRRHPLGDIGLGERDLVVLGVQMLSDAGARSVSLTAPMS